MIIPLLDIETVERIKDRFDILIRNFGVIMLKKFNSDKDLDIVEEKLSNLYGRNLRLKDLMQIDSQKIKITS